MKIILSDLGHLGGVYEITNAINKKVYIGSCKQFKQRSKEHLRSLKSDKHSNKYLQNSFKKYGPGAFTFTIIEVVLGTKEIRTSIEQEYLNKFLNQWDMCYNIAKKAICKHGPWSKTPEKTCLERSKRMREKWKDPSHRLKVSKANSEATKAQWADPIKGPKIKSAQRENAKMRKGTSWGLHSKITKQKIGEALKGNSWNKGRKLPDHQGKIARKNLAKYRWSAKRINNLKESLRKKNGQMLVWNLDTPDQTISFDSLKAASKNMRISHSTISRVLNGTVKSTKNGWIFKWEKSN